MAKNPFMPKNITGKVKSNATGDGSKGDNDIKRYTKMSVQPVRSNSAMQPRDSVMTEIPLPSPRTPKPHPTNPSAPFTTIPKPTKIQ